MSTCQVFHDGRSETVADVKVGLAAAREAHGFVWVELARPAQAGHLRAAHFVSLTTLRRTGAGRSLQIGRVMAFVGEAFVVTVRQEDGDTLQRARRRLSKAAGGRLTPLDVLHALVDTVVEDLAGVSRQVENAILGTADRLFTAQRSDES